MPIIDSVGRKTPKIRLMLIAMYLLLTLLGVTMVYPFLITLTSSTTNALDYYRFAPTLRALWFREERFVHLLVPYFPETLRGGMEQFSFLFPDAPSNWTTWKSAGEDEAGIEKFAKGYLGQLATPERRAQVEQAARDYADFSRQYPITDSLCAYNERDLATFFRETYTAQARKEMSGKSAREVEIQGLKLMKATWQVPVTTWYIIKPGRELSTPWDQPNYIPPADGRNTDFARLRSAYQDGQLLPGGVDRSTCYVSQTRPVPLKLTWLNWLRSKDAQELMGVPAGTAVTIENYNTVFGTRYPSLQQTPFPVTVTAPARLQRVWDAYLQTQFPRRLLGLRITPAMTVAYQAFLRGRFKGDLARCNALLNTHQPSWQAFRLAKQMPVNEAEASLWAEFSGSQPASMKIPNCAEAAFQEFLRQKYSTLSALNSAYGWQLQDWSQAEMPFNLAYLATFSHNERPLLLAALTENYRFVGDYLLRRGRAVGNTLLLVVLAILMALTVNPLAAYALSRFQLKQTPAVILFLLATMAFPAAVTVIPGFLLMRDLHMLNTFWALVLPGVANGMSIFLLKGFFDSLPPELYEAAALDGAPEWTVFLRITLPLSMPILAVIALNSFIAAYNSWEWALVVCQKQEMWTVAVWLYQFNTQWATQPWAVMASFVVASIPVFLVFLLCQNIIL
ncbi:MAG TPA: ABC transporter permease subunit, partial [Armatimonadota bacterium]